VIGIMKGLTDPIVGQLMGQTAENLAWKFGITREEMDAFAVESHRRVCAAQDAGHFCRRDRAADRPRRQVYAADDGVRRDSSMANLAKLKPFFDKKYGRVTPGNSSQITDGAAWLVLASEEAVERTA
jgi:acetyl-CoA C-acetyltransferase